MIIHRSDRDYYNMTTDAWKLFKKYFSQVKDHPEIMDDDSWWQMLINEGDALAKKYNECQFIKALVINNIFNEFDSLWKNYQAGKDVPPLEIKQTLNYAF